MLVFSEQSLAFIAVPKTGSTALELALKPRADIILTKRRKHLSARRFHRRIAPFLAEEFGVTPERFAVIREPEEQLRSWYRYRARKAKSGSDFSTRAVSFDAFVRQVIRETPPPFAAVGSQLAMLTAEDGAVLVHHLFAHETPSRLLDFLGERFGEEIEVKRRNVSPPVPAELEPATRRALRHARAAEFELYARVMEAGGRLLTPVAGYAG